MFRRIAWLDNRGGDGGWRAGAGDTGETVGDSQGAAQPVFDGGGWKRVSLPYAWNEDSAYRQG
jgi:hypothetical protein